MKRKFIYDYEYVGRPALTGRPMDIGYYFSMANPGTKVIKIVRDEQKYGYVVWYEDKED